MAAKAKPSNHKAKPSKRKTKPSNHEAKPSSDDAIWAEIEVLLDQVLDQREAEERRIAEKIERHFGPTAVPPLWRHLVATPPRKPMRKP